MTGKKPVPTRRQRTKEELERALQDQLGFLKRSAIAFDEGQIAESTRLATTLRVLLYDKGKSSQSLLGQLGLLARNFWDTTYPWPLEEPPKGFCALTMVFFPDGGGHGEYLARLDDMPSRRFTPFSTWWTAPVLRTTMGMFYQEQTLSPSQRIRTEALTLIQR